MAFDITTAKPVKARGSFDLSTAKIVKDASQYTPPARERTKAEYILPSWATSYQEKPGERTLLGDIFERPGAAIRSAIRGEGYMKGALRPEEVPTFQEQSLEAPVKTFFQPTGQNRLMDAMASIEHFTRGLGRDIGGMAADVATQPADVLTLLAGQTPPAKAAGRQIVKARPAQAAGRFLTKERRLPTKLTFGPQRVNQTIDYGIRKSIRPSVVGKRTASQVKAYENNAREAVKTIVENKNILSFTDEIGESVKKLPESLAEFSEAIGQTKSQIFNLYDDLLKQSGKQEASVDLLSIARKLNPVVKNKALMLKDPAIVKHASGLQSRLFQAGKLSVKETDDLIKMFNKSLEAFYKNPSYDTAARATIDAGVVNNLRSALDDVVTKTTGQPFQILKNKYGALKVIERDVNRRAVVDARRNVKGLLDFTDIFSAGDMVRGITNLNPGSFAKGVVQAGLKKIYKKWNDPNYIVKQMFKEVDRFHVPGPALRFPEIIYPGIQAQQPMPIGIPFKGQVKAKLPPGQVTKRLAAPSPETLKKGMTRPGEGFTVTGGLQRKGTIGKKWAKILRTTPPEKIPETIDSMPSNLKQDAIQFVNELWQDLLKREAGQ